MRRTNSQRSAAPVLCGAGDAVFPPSPFGGQAFFPPATGAGGVDPRQDAEGMERRAAHHRSAPGEARARLGQTRSPRGAPSAAISVPGAVASGRDAGAPFWGSLIRAASAALRSRARPALKGQPVLVPADGWPGPPGSGVTSPARGRRTLLRLRLRLPEDALGPSKARVFWRRSVAEV
jgi:hypothetical protein